MGRDVWPGPAAHRGRARGSGSAPPLGGRRRPNRREHKRTDGGEQGNLGGSHGLSPRGDPTPRGWWMEGQADAHGPEGRRTSGRALDAFDDEEIPPLQDVVDLAVNRDDLYLLHADGNLTLCFLSGFGGVPTRCSDPNYVDFRPGRENLPLIPANPLTQLMITPPPDPSIFMLEPESQSINHFSLRNLAFQRQYLPGDPLSPRDATAFFVDNIHHVLFLAIGNELYYAPIP